MNVLDRFWYSAYELITKRSMYKDMPFVGVTFFFVFLLILIGGAILMILKNLSIMYLYSVPNRDISRLQFFFILLAPFFIIYLASKKRGRRLLESFKCEDATRRKKRKLEFKLIVGIIFAIFVCSYIWRACLE